MTEELARLRAMLSHGLGAVIVLDAAGQVAWASGTFEELFGLEPDEAPGLFDPNQLHPDDLGPAVELFQLVLSEPGATGSLTARLVDPDGSVRWIDSTLTNLLDDQHVAGLVAHIVDVTGREEARARLAASEERFRSITDSSPVGIFEQDATGACVFVNETWQDITGRSFDEALGDGWRVIVHPDDRPDTGVDHIQDPQLAPGLIEFRVLRPDGVVRWVATRTALLHDDAGAVRGLVGTMADITDKVEAAAQATRLQAIFELTSDYVALLGPDARVLWLNGASRTFLGVADDVDPAEVDLFATLTQASRSRFQVDALPALVADNVWEGELELEVEEGHVTPVLAKFLMHTRPDGTIEFFSGVLRDIAERKAFEHQLAHQATHDPLTGLPNRTLFLDRLEHALAMSRHRDTGVAVLFCDLDHFKVVNDSLGHAFGDRLLIETADRLRAQLRGTDTMARFGGDEFVVLCEDVRHIDEAVVVADRMVQALDAPFNLDGTEVFVRTSVGIAAPESPDADPTTLIRDADAAMYRAKQRGRGRIEIFDRELRSHAVDRLDLETFLRRALERRELRVHYQPVVDLGHGGIVGVEALVRWEHPERGLLLPGEFIQIAEETGLIVPVGRWVLEQACRQVARWRAAIPELGDLSVAVNLSSRQLDDARLVDDVADILADTHLSPGSLHLEITESVLMEDVDASLKALDRLHGLGVRLLVDDFGTGYSSLSYLRKFPVHGLKVDRSFVRGLGYDASDTAIVSAVVTLAHTLGMDAVAEGVEEPLQLAELRRLECDRAQGFHMARPAPDQTIADLLVDAPRW